MPQDTLLLALEEDARNQARRIIEEAEEEAKKIIEGAEAEARSLRERRLAELSSALEKKKAYTLNTARTRAAGAGLRARHGLIDQVLRDTLERFRSMSGHEYSVVLNGLYEELKREWDASGEDRPIVLVNPADTGLLNDGYGEVRADKDVSLGVVFTSKDGKVRFDNTVPSRLRKSRAELMPLLDKLLFGG